MRGKVYRLPFFSVPVWITPAYAGKRAHGRSRCLWLTDHPRLCGEKWRWRLKRTRRIGSPPPMRGKVNLSSLSYLLIGITPAYAGKSAPAISPVMMTWDHPRLCGEKFLLCKKMKCNGGSPPPMRGKGGTVLSRVRCDRITPAYAGKSQREA